MVKTHCILTRSPCVMQCKTMENFQNSISRRFSIGFFRLWAFCNREDQNFRLTSISHIRRSNSDTLFQKKCVFKRKYFSTRLIYKRAINLKLQRKLIVHPQLSLDTVLCDDSHSATASTASISINTFRYSLQNQVFTLFL